MTLTVDSIIDEIFTTNPLTDGEKQFLADVFETAHIDYWANTVNYKHTDEDLVAVLESNDPDGWGHDNVEGPLVVDYKVLHKGTMLLITNVLNKKYQNPYLKQFVNAWLTEGECGDFDSNVADIVVQLGLFGEIVYA
jgi:hypothetical protein